MSTYSVAGVSIFNGEVKVRFCSDLVLRIKNLQKQGDTDIQLIELPNPMTKVQACQFLLDSGHFSKYTNEIKEILGKKESKVQQPKIVVEKTETDSEIEAIKELAAA